MSTPPAGWFPDPDGQDRLRYWDGSAWTDHYASSGQVPGAQGAPGAPGYGAPAEPAGYGQSPSGGYGTTPPAGHGQSPSGDAYGTGAAPGAGYGSAPAPGWADTAGSAYGAQAQGPQGGAPGAYGGYGQPPGGPGGPPPGGGSPGTPPSGGQNKGLIWTLVGIGAAIVIALVILAVNLISGGGDDDPTAGPTPTAAPTDEPTADPTDEPTETPTDAPTGAQSAGEVVLEDTVIDTVPENGTWDLAFTVSEDGLYVIAAETLDSGDLTLELRDDSGTQLQFTDYPPNAAEALVGSYSDAMLTGYYTAGEYTVVVADYFGDETEAAVSASHVTDAVEIPTETAAFTVPEGSAWFGYVTVEDGTTLTLDPRTTNGTDLTMSLVAPDGTLPYENDDRGGETASDIGGDRYDPYIEAGGLDAGRYVVVIGEYYGDAAEATIVATHE